MRSPSLLGSRSSLQVRLWLIQVGLIGCVLGVSLFVGWYFVDFRTDVTRSEYLGSIMYGVVAAHLTPVATLNPPTDLQISVRKIGDFLDDGLGVEQPIPVPKIRFGNDWPPAFRLRIGGTELPSKVIKDLGRITYAEDFFVALSKALVEHGETARLIAHLDQSRAIAFDATEIWRPRLSRSVILGIGAAAVFILFAVSFMVARATSRRIRDLAANLESANAENAVIEESGPQELRQVQEVLNRIVGANSEKDAERVRMLAAVSHDLHTPFTRMRLHAEFIADPEVKSNMLKDLDEIDVMLDESIRFLKHEDRREDLQVVDIVSLVQSLCDDAADMGDSVAYRDVPERTAAAEDPDENKDSYERIWVKARPFALRRAVMNVVRNAVRFGGKAEVRIVRNNDTVQINIDNPGPGIPEEVWQKISLPFFRLEGSRSKGTGGTGLGLAITKSVTDDLNGNLDFTFTDDGWFQVSITLELVGGE